MLFREPISEVRSRTLFFLRTYFLGFHSYIWKIQKIYCFCYFRPTSNFFAKLACFQSRISQFLALRLELFQLQSLAMDLLLCQQWHSLSISPQEPQFAIGVRCKPSHFVPSHAPFSGCLVQVLLPMTQFFVVHQTAPVRSWRPTKIPWVMRLVNEQTPSSPILRNQTVSPQCAGGPPHQFVSVRSFFHLHRFSFCSRLRLQNGEASWAAGCRLRCGTRVFCSAEVPRGFCIVVSLLVQPFPHDRWPCDHPQGGPLWNHFHSRTCLNHRILKWFRASFIVAFQNDCAKTKICDETYKK